jgi:uncharacterized protein GlcG (DUF336 family)
MDRFPSKICLAALAWLLFAGGIAFAAPATLPTPASKQPPPSISLAEAITLIDGAIAYAREHNVLMAVAIVDASGNLMASARMDGVSANDAWYAEGKAFTAALQRQTTESLSQLAKDRPDRYFGIMAMYPGKMYIVGGGEPLTANGVLVGAIGVSGLAQHEDEAAGRAGMAAWERTRSAGQR